MRSIRNVLVALMVISLFIACQDNKEGCLDPNALNLDVSADENANCRYPTLGLNISHRWITETPDTVSFVLGSSYVLASGDTLVPMMVDFYISDVALGGADGLAVFDSVELVDGTFYRDDLTALDATTGNNEIGHVRTYGSYDGVTFHCGFADTWNSVDTAKLRRNDANHPWFDAALVSLNRMRFDARIKADIHRTDGSQVSRSFSFVDMPVSQVDLTAQTVNTAQASNVTLNVLLKYNEVFNVDILSADTTAIKERMWSNLSTAFAIIN